MNGGQRQKASDARWNDRTSPDRDGLRVHDVALPRHETTSSRLGGSSGGARIGHNWDDSAVDRPTKRERLMQRIGSGGVVLALAFVLALCVAFLNYQDRGLQEQHWPTSMQKVVK